MSILQRHWSQDSTTTLQLLKAAHTCNEPQHGNLYREICRINDSKAWDTSELISLSAKLTQGKLNRNRYDSSVQWTDEEAVNFYTNVVNAAPTRALQDYFENPCNYIADWICAVNRSFSYLAVDYDKRVYKIYLFDPLAPSFIDTQDLHQLLPRLHQSSYINCLEIDIDQPQHHTHSVYFKLNASSLSEVLEPGYQPNPQITNRLLQNIDNSQQVVDALRSICSGLQRVTDPVIKFPNSPGENAGSDGVNHLSAADYGISINTFDPSCLKYINDYRDEILAISNALACRNGVEEWLDAIRAFDCFIGYICVGGDFVTFYYKSTSLVQKNPTTFTRG